MAVMAASTSAVSAEPATVSVIEAVHKQAELDAAETDRQVIAACSKYTYTFIRPKRTGGDLYGESKEAPAALGDVADCIAAAVTKPPESVDVPRLIDGIMVEQALRGRRTARLDTRGVEDDLVTRITEYVNKRYDVRVDPDHPNLLEVALPHKRKR